MPNTIILTSNMEPDKWGIFFIESVLKCAMDHIFDRALPIPIKEHNYYGNMGSKIEVTAGIDPLRIPGF